MDYLYISLIFIIGIFSGLIGGTVGGGGLISSPFLIFAGLSPHVAVATNGFGALGNSFSSVFAYFRSKKIEWRTSIILAVLAAIGGTIGASLLVTINEDAVQKTLAIAIVLALPFVLLKKGIGTTKIDRSLTTKIIGFLLIFALQIYGGLIGAGTGILILYIMILFLGFPIVDAKATEGPAWVMISICTVAVYFYYDLIDLDAGVSLFIGRIIGGYIGARFAILKGNSWVMKLFAIVVIASAIKLGCSG